MKVLKYLLLFLVIVFLLSSKSGNAQVSIRLGYGFPDYINAGYQYNFEQKALGIGLGAYPFDDDLMLSFKGGFYYYFAGRRNHSLIREWYVSPGLMYNVKYVSLDKDQYLWINAKIGREFSFSPAWGMYAELGFSVLTFGTIDHNSNSIFNLGNPVGAVAGFGLYYRFPEDCNCPKIKRNP